MKRIFSLLLTLCLLFSLAACGMSEPDATEIPSQASPAVPTAPAAPQATEETAEETHAPRGHYPITVTDQAGRAVTLEDAPQRIVTGYYIATSTVMALGLQDSLVGIEAKADKRPLYRFSAPELLELPSVGTAKEFDLEGCAALEPDLVILPLKLKNAADTLETLGINVLLINPESQALLMEAVYLVAAATDTEDRAEALEIFNSDQLSNLQTITEAAPTVYLAGNSSLLSTAGGAMYQSDMIRNAGGINVAADITDTYWVEVSYEQLLAWDPEYIVLASDATYTVEDVLNDENLAGCTAVKEGNVLQMPNKAEAWDSPVASGILGSVWLASNLHSEAFTPVIAENIIDSFYQEFYGFSYSEA